MITRISMVLFLVHVLLLLGLPACLVQAAPLAQGDNALSASSDYWVANINRQGSPAFGQRSGYKVYRNVKDFGAKGIHTAHVRVSSALTVLKLTSTF